MSDGKDKVITFLKGLFMGTADIIPGISGGTIALITGIYTRLIDAIDHVADFFKEDNWKGWKNVKDWFFGIDWVFLIPLVLGIASAFLLLSNAIHYLLENHITLTFSFFFGLILASSWFVYKELDDFSPLILLSSFFGLLFGFVIVGLPKTEAGHSLLVLFGSGAVAITAMILPGISGALILLILGQYQHVLGLIKDLDPRIGVFGLGAVTGLLLFSKVLHHLLHKYRNETMGFLTGLMIGSLRLPAAFAFRPEGQLVGVIVWVAVGFAVVFVLEGYLNANS